MWKKVSNEKVRKYFINTKRKNTKRLWMLLWNFRYWYNTFFQKFQSKNGLKTNFLLKTPFDKAKDKQINSDTDSDIISVSYHEFTTNDKKKSIFMGWRYPKRDKKLSRKSCAVCDVEIIFSFMLIHSMNNEMSIDSGNVSITLMQK